MMGKLKNFTTDYSQFECINKIPTKKKAKLSIEVT